MLWCRTRSLALAAFLAGCGSSSSPPASTVVDSAVVVDSTAPVDSSTAPETIAETTVMETSTDTFVAVDTFEPPTDGSDDTGTIDTSYDGPLPTISIDDQSISEGNTGEKTITFNLSLSAPMPVPVSVKWATADGTATSADYVTASGKVVFGPGIINVPVDLKIKGDTTIEVDENFFVDLSEPLNGTIDKARGKATILDDDTPGPSISIADVTIVEGDVGTKDVNFTVTLSETSTKTVSVSWSTIDGTAKSAGTTTGETDYAPGSGTFSFAPGETSKTVTVSLRSDGLDEADETFDVELSSAVNGSISKSRGTCTITDDDNAPTISINDVSLSEGPSGSTKTFVFEISLSGPSGRPITVSWATANGTALAPSDYIAASGTVTFAPGDTKHTIGVVVVGNNVVEPNETFDVKLSSPVNATLLDDTGIGTIVNDD